jgi:hypothetical protein
VKKKFAPLLVGGFLGTTLLSPFTLRSGSLKPPSSSSLSWKSFFVFLKMKEYCFCFLSFCDKTSQIRNKEKNFLHQQPGEDPTGKARIFSSFVLFFFLFLALLGFFSRHVSTLILSNYLRPFSSLFQPSAVWWRCGTKGFVTVNSKPLRVYKNRSISEKFDLI